MSTFKWILFWYFTYLRFLTMLFYSYKLYWQRIYSLTTRLKKQIVELRLDSTRGLTS